MAMVSMTSSTRLMPRDRVKLMSRTLDIQCLTGASHARSIDDDDDDDDEW